MAANTLPPIEYLRKVLDYDPDTGVLAWKRRPREMFKAERDCNVWNTRFAGKVAGNVHTHPSGYKSMQVALNDKDWIAHRIAFAIYHGREPKEQIDHLNRDSLDNRICNLREASDVLNQWNQIKPQKNSNSGYRGVGWHKRTQKWQARIGINGTRKHLGLFDTPEQAHAAYLQAKEKYHQGAVIA